MSFTYDTIHLLKVYNSQSYATITTVKFWTFLSPQKGTLFPLAITATPSSPEPITLIYSFAFSGYFI